MFAKTKAVALALTLFAVPATAFAQTAVGTIQVTDEGLPYVIEYCETLESLGRSDRSDYEPSLSQRVASGIHLKSVQLSDCQNARLL